MKFLFIFFLLILICTAHISKSWPDDIVHIVFCDVGQGDAMIIYQGFTQILIDGGRDETVLHCLNEYLPFWDKNVEIIVATHPDADHITGLTSVFKHYSASFVISNGDFKKTADFEDFKNAVSRKLTSKTKLLTVSFGDTIVINEQLRLFVISPQAVTAVNSREKSRIAETMLWDKKTLNLVPEESSNDRSITLFLQYKQISALLTGDLEKQGELALLENGLITRGSILKVGHHGSKSSTTSQLLSTFRPEISVISSGKNNSYGHPAPEVVTRLKEFGAHILRTDEVGTIHLVSDGEKIWLY